MYTEGNDSSDEGDDRSKDENPSFISPVQRIPVFDHRIQKPHRRDYEEGIEVISGATEDIE